MVLSFQLLSSIVYEFFYSVSQMVVISNPFKHKQVKSFYNKKPKGR